MKRLVQVEKKYKKERQARIAAAEQFEIRINSL